MYILLIYMDYTHDHFGNIDNSITDTHDIFQAISTNTHPDNL